MLKSEDSGEGLELILLHSRSLLSLKGCYCQEPGGGIVSGWPPPQDRAGGATLKWGAGEKARGPAGPGAAVLRQDTKPNTTMWPEREVGEKVQDALHPEQNGRLALPLWPWSSLWS